MSKYRPTVVDMAYEIVAMDNELQALRTQVKQLEEFRKKYMDLLDSNIKHGDRMMANMLDLLITPGVAEAAARAK